MIRDRSQASSQEYKLCIEYTSTYGKAAARKILLTDTYLEASDDIILDSYIAYTPNPYYA